MNYNRLFIIVFRNKMLGGEFMNAILLYFALNFKPNDQKPSCNEPFSIRPFLFLTKLLMRP